MILSLSTHLGVKTTLTDDHQTGVDRLRIQTPKIYETHKIICCVSPFCGEMQAQQDW